MTAFEKQTGIKVNVRNDDEGTLANLIAVQGSHTPGDVFFTENSPPLEFLQEKGLLSKVSPATLADTPAKYNSPDGDWVGVSARVSVMVYNPSLITKSQLPTSVMQLADPKYQGKLAFAAVRDGLSADRHLGRARLGQPAALKSSARVKSNGSSRVYPGQRDDHQSGESRGAVRVRPDQPVLLVPHARPSSERPRRTRGSPSSRRTTPATCSTCREPECCESSKHKAAAQRFLAFLVSKPGCRRSSPTPDGELRVSDRLGRAGSSAPQKPFGELQPNSITLAELGDGSAAINLLRQAGLL